ncbi:hypothetical protein METBISCDRAFT_21279 [Metschnikowia bicuspidata]|uniref:Uncharacterized protein n=1 Tax=Metschnikowia bicuspidata TaxID=27322 RepID=A0A4P9ZJK9_9ASCO|nr:hypothetical protein METBISCDRAFT_21279 [Metschnikowia bicuspidata]
MQNFFGMDAAHTPQTAQLRMVANTQFDKRAQMMAPGMTSQHAQMLGALQQQFLTSSDTLGAPKNAMADKKLEPKIVPAALQLEMPPQPQIPPQGLLQQPFQMLQRQSPQMDHQGANNGFDGGKTQQCVLGQRLQSMAGQQQQQPHAPQMAAQQQMTGQHPLQQPPMQSRPLQMSAPQVTAQQMGQMGHAGLPPALQTAGQMSGHMSSMGQVPSQQEQMQNQQLYLRQHQLLQQHQLQMQQTSAALVLHVPPLSLKSLPDKNGPSSAGGTSASNAAQHAAACSAAAHASQMASNLRIYKRNLGNTAVLRVLDLIDFVANEPPESLTSYGFWQNTCQVHAVPTAVLRITVPVESGGNDDDEGLGNTRLYMLNVSTAPQFFLAKALASNVASKQFSLPGLRYHILGSGAVFMTSRLSYLRTYKDESSTHITGFCRLLMSRDFRLELVDCTIVGYTSQVSLLQLEKRWVASTAKNDGQEREFMKRVFNDTLARAVCDGGGFSENVMRVLKISDVMMQLRPLMAFTAANGLNSPIKSLDVYVNSNKGCGGPGARDKVKRRKRSGMSPMNSER